MSSQLPTRPRRIPMSSRSQYDERLRLSLAVPWESPALVSRPARHARHPTRLAEHRGHAQRELRRSLPGRLELGSSALRAGEPRGGLLADLGNLRGSTRRARASARPAENDSIVARPESVPKSHRATKSRTEVVPDDHRAAEREARKTNFGRASFAVQARPGAEEHRPVDHAGKWHDTTRITIAAQRVQDLAEVLNRALISDHPGLVPRHQFGRGRDVHNAVEPSR